jgi:hypothetical protein
MLHLLPPTIVIGKLNQILHFLQIPCRDFAPSLETMCQNMPFESGPRPSLTHDRLRRLQTPHPKPEFVFWDMMMSSYLDMLKIHEQDDGEVVKRFINSVPVRFRESAVPRNDHRLQWLFNESA